jgi:hypothetical protein
MNHDAKELIFSKCDQQKPFDFILICAGIKRAAPVKDRY